MRRNRNHSQESLSHVSFQKICLQNDSVLLVCVVLVGQGPTKQFRLNLHLQKSSCCSISNAGITYIYNTTSSKINP